MDMSSKADIGIAGYAIRQSGAEKIMQGRPRPEYLHQMGGVERYHTCNVQNQSTADHTWRMMSLMYTLAPVHLCQDVQFMWALHFHDAPEKHLGDNPATAKWNHPNLTHAVWWAEKEFYEFMQLPTHHDLDDFKTGWFKGLDLLELCLWCYHVPRTIDATEVYNRGMKALVNLPYLPNEIEEYVANLLPTEINL